MPLISALWLHINSVFAAAGKILALMTPAIRNKTVRLGGLVQPTCAGVADMIHLGWQMVGGLTR